MQAIRKLCERIMTFFIKKSLVISSIVDDSKIIDENTDDLEFGIPARMTDLDSPSSLHTPSLPNQMPTALEFLEQQRLACKAMDIDTQHLDEDKDEDKQGASSQ